MTSWKVFEPTRGEVTFVSKKILWEKKYKGKQSVVICEWIAALFYSTFFENVETSHVRSPPCSDLISIPKIRSEER